MDTIKKDFLEELANLDTGKAQPLYHPYPVINIFREDEAVKEAEKKEKAEEEEKLLIDKKGILCDAAETVKPEIAVNLEREGAVMNKEEQDEADFVIAMDSDAAFLKYAITKGCPALKTTYGLVSRYGMDIDAPSLAQPAVGAQNAAICAAVLETIAGVDKKDPMSRDAYIYEYLTALADTDLTGVKIAIPESLEAMELNELQISYYNQMLDVLEEKGAEIETVELDWIQYAVPVHEMIAACEKVMTADEILMDCADEEESMQLGSFLLEEENYEQYYLKALKLRSLIKDSYDVLFRNYALFVVPFTEKKDSYSIAANLAGLPAMVFPYVPYGMEMADGANVISGLHMIAGANCENNLIKAAYVYEQEVQ